MHVDDRLDHGRRLFHRPVEIEPVLADQPPCPAQSEPAVGGVDALREPRHGILQRAQLAHRCDHEHEECLHARVGRLGRRDPVGDQVGQPAVLDPERLSTLAAIQEIDGAGDGWPLGGLHLAGGVERRRQEIAVAAPVVAEPSAHIGQRARHVAAAQQHLGRGHRSRGKHHQARLRGAWDPAPPLEAIVADLVAASGRLDVGDEVQRPHVGALALGERQVVAVERVPGVDLAADVAIAEMHAGALLHALRIGEALAVAHVEGGGARIVPFAIEGHGELELLEAASRADGLGAVAHELHLLRPLVVRHGLHVHHAPDRCVVRRHRLPGDLGRPAAIEDELIRHRRDVGVDQRAAAHRGALGHRHMLEDAQVEPAVPALGSLVAPPPRIGVLARVGLGVPASAALEHQHAVAGLCQPARAHRAAKTAADDDCVEIHRRCLLQLGRPGMKRA